MIAINGAPSNAKLRVGIKQPNGNKRYIKGTEDIFYTFTLNQNGDYQIFVKNLTDKNVKINGYYNIID